MIDLRLYALLDPERAGGRDLADLARALEAGGATLLQLRDKRGATRCMIEQARAIKVAVRVPLVVNDRADVALAAGADGVHVGWDDIAVADARRLLGDKSIIGLSIKTMQQAQAAPLHLLDYVCIGGVFATSSKDNPNPPIGVGGFKTLAAAVRARELQTQRRRRALLRLQAAGIPRGRSALQGSDGRLPGRSDRRRRRVN